MADQTILSQIAQATKGAFHYAATQDVLQQIYNEIASGTTIGATLANDVKKLRPFLVLKSEASVSTLQSQILFLVNWQDPNLTFVPGQVPGMGQIAVQINGPTGYRLDNAKLVTVGKGYAVYLVSDATPGTYSAQAKLMSGQHNSAVLTIGIFDPANVIRLLSMPSRQAVVTGQQPMEILSAATTSSGHIFNKTNVQVTLHRPLAAPPQINQMPMSAMAMAAQPVYQTGVPDAGGAPIDHMGMLASIPMGEETIASTTHPLRGGDLTHISEMPTVPGPHVAFIRTTAYDDVGFPTTLVKRVSFWAY